MKKSSIFMGAALAGLALAGGLGAKEAKEKAKEGECHGINGCKGQGECGNKDHSCGGQKAGQGPGWEKKTEGQVKTTKRKIQTAFHGDVTGNIGLGLRTEHFNRLLKNPETKIAWFEAITENFIDTAGAPLRVLTKLRQRYPVALHGVALSIGSVDGVRPE